MLSSPVKMLVRICQIVLLLFLLHPLKDINVAGIVKNVLMKVKMLPEF